MAFAEQADPAFRLLPDDQQADPVPAAGWGRKAAGFAIAAVLLVAVVSRGGVGKFPGVQPTTQVDSSLLQVLQTYPSPNTVEAANEFFAALPAHVADEVISAHLSPHTDALFDDFLTVFGTTTPLWGAPQYQVEPLHAYASPEERARRFNVFRESLASIVKLNSESQAEQRPDRAVFGINGLSDWTWDEFSAMLGGVPYAAKMPTNSTDAFAMGSPSARTTLASSVHSMVRKTAQCNRNYAASYPNIFKIRSQGTCGSCWAYTATQEIRATHFLWNGVDPGPLSVQYLLDCETDVQHKRCGSGVDGCCGGNPISAYQYVAKSGGIPRKKAYGPYTSEPHPGVDFACKWSVPKAVTVKSSVQTTSEARMGEILCQNGPLSVTVYANSAWQHYVGGVLQPGNCAGSAPNHAVQAVGLDASRNAYIIRNSWGANWGVTAAAPYSGRGSKRGFILIKYGSNTCNIAMWAASIPTGLSDVVAEGALNQNHTTSSTAFPDVTPL